jgi:hypothetical protein
MADKDNHHPPDMQAHYRVTPTISKHHIIMNMQNEPNFSLTLSFPRRRKSTQEMPPEKYAKQTQFEGKRTQMHIQTRLTQTNLEHWLLAFGICLGFRN